ETDIQEKDKKKAKNKQNRARNGKDKVKSKPKNRFRRVKYLELPWILEDPYVEAALQAPPSPDYVPGLEEPKQAPPSPDYVPGPEHADDEIVAEDQPDAEDASPTAQSPDYVPESDPEADPEEDDDEDPEEDPVDYSADGGDDGDDEDEPSEEDEDDDVDMEADGDEEEEEHPAPADSVVVALPATDQAPSAEETEPFETDESAATPPPHPAYRVTARISIPAPVPTPVWSDAEVARLLAISTPPSSPLSPWSSPLPQIPSPSLPLSPPSPVLSPALPPSLIRSLGYQAAMIWLRAEAASTSHSLPLPPPFILSPTRSDAPSSGIPPPLPISVPTSSPLLLLPSASHREDRPEVTLPPRKRLGIALGPRYEVGESSSTVAARPAGGLRADYSFAATMDREIRHDPERELGRHMTAFETRVRQDTNEIYKSLDDEQSQRQLLASWLNMLFRDRRAHAYTRHLMETEARLSERLGGVNDASDDSGYHTNRDSDEHHRKRLPHCRDSRDPLEVLHNQSCQRRLVAVHRLDHVMASHFVYSLLSITVSNPGRGALTWWNSHVIIVSHDVAYVMTWADLRKKMTEKYCLRNEMKKLEAKLWNLKVKGTDVIGYNQHFQELALLCVRMFPLGVQIKIERGTGQAQNPTLPIVGVQGHFKRECPKLKNNKNRGNQVGNDRASSRKCMRCFQMDITPSTLDHYYDVELADGRIIRLNTILRGCTLNLLNHPFNINLMPVELGSFDAIIGMDWLAKYQAIIVCAEKIVRLVGLSSDSTKRNYKSIGYLLLAPVARRLIDLAPFDMKELSEQQNNYLQKAFKRP
ncbi:putative reverse transcriptase domain-containing protein, partial [Tanacetum coccineum]